MLKVTIEITANGFEKTIHIGEKKYSEYHRINSSGSISEGTLLEDSEISEEHENLIEVMNDNFLLYDIAIAMDDCPKD